MRLLDGVADRLVVIGPILRPLIELHWTRDVARWTRLPMEDDDLRSHLFGTERTNFPKRLVGELSDPQHAECFYCGDRLIGQREVDHFLAWSRWPNDAIENLVLADRCNATRAATSPPLNTSCAGAPAWPPTPTTCTRSPPPLTG